jgi:hypothetical protein
MSIGLVLLIALVILLAGGFHSSLGYSYGGGGIGLGTILVIVLILILLGKL